MNDKQEQSPTETGAPHEATWGASEPAKVKAEAEAAKAARREKKETDRA